MLVTNRRRAMRAPTSAIGVECFQQVAFDALYSARDKTTLKSEGQTRWVFCLNIGYRRQSLVQGISFPKIGAHLLYGAQHGQPGIGDGKMRLRLPPRRCGAPISI